MMMLLFHAQYDTMYIMVLPVAAVKSVCRSPQASSRFDSTSYRIVWSIIGALIDN